MRGTEGRVRNPCDLNKSGLCALHGKSQRLRDKAVLAANDSRPGKALNVTTTAEVIGGTIVSIPTVIADVIRIVVEFVSSNWPQIPHLARHRLMKPKPNSAANLIRDCERMIKSGHRDTKFGIEV